MTIHGVSSPLSFSLSFHPSSSRPGIGGKSCNARKPFQLFIRFYSGSRFFRFLAFSQFRLYSTGTCTCVYIYICINCVYFSPFLLWKMKRLSKWNETNDVYRGGRGRVWIRFRGSRNHSNSSCPGLSIDFIVGCETASGRDKRKGRGREWKRNRRRRRKEKIGWEGRKEK